MSGSVEGTCAPPVETGSPHQARDVDVSGVRTYLRFPVASYANVVVTATRPAPHDAESSTAVVPCTRPPKRHAPVSLAS